jgi:hypothetical protein
MKSRIYYSVRPVQPTKNKSVSGIQQPQEYYSPGRIRTGVLGGPLTLEGDPEPELSKPFKTIMEFRERWKGRKERRLGVGHPRLPHLPSPRLRLSRKAQVVLPPVCQQPPRGLTAQALAGFCHPPSAKGSLDTHAQAIPEVAAPRGTWGRCPPLSLRVAGPVSRGLGRGLSRPLL